MRNQILESQKKLNYQFEYDSIRGVLSQSVLRGSTVESLDRRKNDVDKLGAQAVNSISYIILLMEKQLIKQFSRYIYNG